MFKHLITNCWRGRTSTFAGFCSTGNSPLVIEQLAARGVIKASGEETSAFMQGLITNDMRHLEEGACSMYTMFLNTKGRVMYDAIIYKAREKGSFFIECDMAALPALQRHLSLYRVRKKINLESLVDSISVWALFNPNSIENLANPPSKVGKNLPGAIVPCTSLEGSNLNDMIEIPKDFISDHNLVACPDPRVGLLGFRILSPRMIDLTQIAEKELGATSPNKDTQYKLLRFKLGIGEGVDDLPPGNCFPLEANCDYLHGVSFHKGCYIGQELTARTHHTGVVRKRLMPIEFDAIPTEAITTDAPIKLGNNCSRPVGKLRGAEGRCGLALLRISEALESTAMKVLDVTCQTMKPAWWPQEAPKDRVSIGKDTTTN